MEQLQSQIKQLAIKQLLTDMVLRYGVDDLIRGLRIVYKDRVWASARGIEAVQKRAGLLDDLVYDLNQLSTMKEES